MVGFASQKVAFVLDGDGFERTLMQMSRLVRLDHQMPVIAQEAKRIEFRSRPSDRFAQDV